MINDMNTAEIFTCNSSLDLAMIIDTLGRFSLYYILNSHIFALKNRLSVSVPQDYEKYHSTFSEYHSKRIPVFMNGNFPLKIRVISLLNR
jgi:hypothetical protein